MPADTGLAPFQFCERFMVLRITALKFYNAGLLVCEFCTSRESKQVCKSSPSLSVYMNTHIHIYILHIYACVCIWTKRKLAPILLLKAGICSFSFVHFMPDIRCELYLEQKFSLN